MTDTRLRPRVSFRSSLAVWSLLAVLLAGAPSPGTGGISEGLAPGSLASDGSRGPVQGTGLGAVEVVHPNLGSQLSELAVATAENGEAAFEPAPDDGANGADSQEPLLLMLQLDGNRDGVLEFLADHGVTPENDVGDYLEVYLPPGLLDPLARQTGVVRVREVPTPFKLRGNVVGAGARSHDALVWHANGFKGNGVKVGVIDAASRPDSKDGFTGLRALMGADLPTTVVGRCYTDVGKPTSDLANCDIAGGDGHGTGVAESLMDVAPDAALYVANPVSYADFHSTVVWMQGQGVKVINYSNLTAWHGAADGTSPFNPSPLNTVKWAADNGITWVGAAGNNGRKAWYGAFADSDGDGWHEWANGNGTNNPDEAQRLWLSKDDYAYVAVRWDDTWLGATRDLDLEVRYSDSVNGAQTVVETSADVQSGGYSHTPHENVGVSASKSGFYWVYLKKKAASATPSWVQFKVVSYDLSAIDHYTDEGSITTPADSASTGAIAVGAAAYDSDGALALESYSSRGPTPDGRTKPDVVGLACSPTNTYGSFCGTSQAAPHVAGLAALVIQRNPAFTPAQVVTYLKANAADRGRSGIDNQWGAGYARLPQTGLTLPDVACTSVLTGSGTTKGAWDQHCVSDAGTAMFGRWYSFAIDQPSTVKIEVSSAAQTLVRLRRGGDARRGPSLYSTGGRTGRAARINAVDLPADDYTIEVISEQPGRVGSFDLKIQGVPALVPSGSQISITAGGDVTEGGDAVFTVSASPAPSAPLTVWVQAAGQGAFSSSDGRQQVTVSKSGSGTLTLSTVDDGADEPDGSVTATVDSSPRYTVSATADSASVAVADNDDPLPQPVPGDDCVSALTGNGSFEAAWTGDCDSQHKSGSRNHRTVRGGTWHARYYTFTLSSPARVTIDLESAWESLPDWVDNYLYLRRGSGTKIRSLVASDDDGGDRHFDARIDTHLAAGDYTIEATTVWGLVTSKFRLSVAGLPEVATPVVSVSAGADVDEGGSASFTVSASPAPAADLSVSVSVSQSGDYGAAVGSRTVTVPASGS
ncbi:MAG: S8 family serine peptidase, partial [Acidimicrobiaceae bacterium]|nr:S8 family serine peptidase [Acidimicrobiaceae bacterium]